MTVRRLFLLPAVVLVAALAGACQPSAEALPRLKDPNEILEEAIRTTAELEFVHARLEAATAGPGVAQQYTVDGDINLSKREFHATADATRRADSTSRGWFSKSVMRTRSRKPSL